MRNADNGLIHGYFEDDDQLIDTYPWFKHYGLADGDVQASASDLTRFVRAILESDNLLNAEMRRELVTPTGLGTLPSNYALGILVNKPDDRGVSILSHGGKDLGTRAIFNHYYLNYYSGKPIKSQSTFQALIIAAALAASACVSTTSNPKVPVAANTIERAIDASVESSLDKLYSQVAGARELVTDAKGVLVFPSVFSIDFVWGSSQGKGAPRMNGLTTDYYETVGLMVGWLAGAKSEAVYLLFMTQEALDAFRSSNGWTAVVDASVAIVKAGANTSVTTDNMKQAVIGFALTNKGLIANVSLDGTKIPKLSL